MRTATARRRGSQTGSALVEGALVFFVFMLIVLGIMDFGRIVWVHNSVSYATREAARYAIVHGSASRTPATSTTIADKVKQNAIGLTPESVTVAIVWSPDNKPGSSVSVSTQYLVTSIVSLVPFAITLKSSSKMIIAQ